MKTNKMIFLPEKDPLIKEVINQNENITNDVEINESHVTKFINHLNEWQKEFVNKYQLSLSLENEIFKGFLAVYYNLCDALVIGYNHASKDVFLYAILFYGQEHFLSTAFITKKDEIQIWSDCALNINPNEEQYSKIILNTIAFAKTLNIPQRIACLSYATYQSAGGESVIKIQKVIEELQNRDKETSSYYIDGPLQFDAATNLKIYEKKTKKHHLTSPFNIFIFPDLNTGNISYKIANQWLKMPFWGAFILGTDKVIVDLSRGAKKEEILEIIAWIEHILHNKHH